MLPEIEEIAYCYLNYIYTPHINSIIGYELKYYELIYEIIEFNIFDTPVETLWYILNISDKIRLDKYLHAFIISGRYNSYDFPLELKYFRNVPNNNSIKIHIKFNVMREITRNKYDYNYNLRLK